MISYGLASTRFSLAHSLIAEEMKKTKEGVLSIEFFKTLSEYLDSYTAFAPKGTTYEYSNGKDNFAAYIISTKDIKREVIP